jgi:protein-S-isoprenylcysteine O-methyltransferase Ste14
MHDMTGPHRTDVGPPSQTTRKFVLLVVVILGLALMLVSESRWPNNTWPRETIEWAGIALMVVCILGRTWCSLYIGGHKHKTLITEGPYSVSRNPLYVFSIIGAIGVGAQVGSIVIAITSGFIVWMVFLATTMREESALLASFGQEYREYVARVPRFMPRPSLWRAATVIPVRPSTVMTTFADALFFLVAIPVAEGIKYMHATGYLPVLISLP